MNGCGNKNSNWKGGKTMHSTGYVLLRMPNHPRANGGYVLEHIILAEKALGKPLPLKAEVHHHNARGDNTQIVICENRAYHKLLHVRTDALRAYGHANWRKCWICKEYDKPENLIINKNNTYHKICEKAYRRKYYSENKRRVKNN